MRPGCNGPCDQGRKSCPTPEACELAADADDGLEAAGLLLVAIVVVLVISLVAASIWRLA
jgi:hypothetical protein